MISVKVMYFGALKERRGMDAETVSTQAKTPAALYAELLEQHDLKLGSEHVRFAINDTFVAADAALADGVTLAVMPPVAGG
ncbi:MAG: MoaD/ThiS family protein [Opitutales bacterium]